MSNKILSILATAALLLIISLIAPKSIQAQLPFNLQDYKGGEKRIFDHPGEFYFDFLCLLSGIFCGLSDINDQTPPRSPTPVGPQPSGQPNPTLPANVPTNREELEKTINDQFGIIMLGFDESHLLLAYFKLVEVSSTKFSTLVHGTTIKAVSDTGSRQPSYKYVELAQYKDPIHFQVIFTHELAHVIRNYARRAESHYSEHIAVYNSSGAVTEYGRTACGRSPTMANKYSEDYADMITYYLNPAAVEQTAPPPCRTNNSNPYEGGRHPKHFELAKKILGQFP